jgi:hypothetical protein
MAVFVFIEGWYNPGRQHSALGYRSSVEFGRVPWRGVAGEGQRELRHGRTDQSAMCGRPTIGSSATGAMVSRVM